MKKILSAALLFILIMSLILLTGCSFKKQVPAYRGMTISSSKTSMSIDGPSGNAFLESGNAGADESIYGSYSGDVVDKYASFNPSNPFPENGSSKNIEAAIKSALNISGNQDTVFYASVNQDIYINIHFYNPDELEIASLSINGVNYTKDQFEVESTTDTVIVKQNVGQARGILEYKLSDVKYVDGNKVSDVITDGSKTALVGIKDTSSITVNVSNVNIGTDTLYFDVNIIDTDNLLAFSGGSLKAVLYDGKSIVAEQDLAIGGSSPIFSKLKAHTRYQYAIVAYYDDLSGLGFGMHVIHKDAFYTDSVVLFDNVSVNQDGIDFSLNWNEDHPQKEITALKLYSEGVLVSALNANQTSISDLLSGKTYTLVAEYLNYGTPDSASIEFTTFKKTEPQISLDYNYNALTQTSIKFKFYEIDPDSIGQISDIKLLLNGLEMVKDTTGKVRDFDNLIHDTAYTIEVNYTYDLNDGNGIITKTESIEISTLPFVAIENILPSKNSIDFDVIKYDTYYPVRISKIELLCNDHVVAKDLTGEINSFGNLFSDTEYVIRVTYIYDLNDGNGERTITKYSSLIKTLSEEIPTVDLTINEVTKTGIGFDIFVNDLDEVGEISSIQLIGKQGTIVAESTEQRTFENLLSNNDYTLTITYVYNLNDGNGDQTITKACVVKTEAKETPTINLDATKITQSGFGFDLNITDNDGIGEITSFKLIGKSGVIDVTDYDTRYFDNLYSDTEYTLSVSYSYNLNDGNLNQTIVDVINVRTDKKDTPTIDIKYPDKTSSSISFRILETDADGIGDIAKIELIGNGKTIVADSTEQRSFYGLEPNTKYTIRVVYAYNLNNGDGVTTIAKTLDIKTNAEISVTDCVVLGNTAFFEGDNMLIKLSLDNPSRVMIREVVIDGKTYSVKSATNSEILLEIPYENKFAGNTTLNIEMIGILDGSQATASHTCDVFINGMIDVIGAELVDKNFLPIDWSRPRDTVYTLLLVNNPTGYNIEGFSKIDDNRWYRVETLKYGWNTLSIDSIEYYNDYLRATYSFPAISDTIYNVKDNLTQYISAPDQLKNMADGYYYELANDIDLAGIEWIPDNFDGVFDGNGYTIKNLTCGITATNEVVYAGLFNDASGIISNLNISGVAIDITASSNDDNRYNVYCGAMVACNTNRLYINNCSVSNSSIKVVSLNGNSFVGGLVGSASELIITNCQNAAEVNSTYAVSGLIGCAQNSTIINCTNNGKISGNTNGAYVAGGIVGLATDVNISGCANNEQISFSIYSGGIVGYATNVDFNDCNNNAAIIGMYTAGGIAGHAGTSTVCNSKNSGDIKGSYSASGLVGYPVDTTIIDSTNSGSIAESNTGD